MQFTAWSFFLLTIVRRPDTSDDMRSLPALAVTIVLCAPETAVRDKKKVICVTIKPAVLILADFLSVSISSDKLLTYSWALTRQNG